LRCLFKSPVDWEKGLSMMGSKALSSHYVV
jgi:hypothetical protein